MTLYGNKLVTMAAALLTTIALAHGASVAASGEDIGTGDANLDERVNSVDAAIMLQFTAGIVYPAPGTAFQKRSDVNEDGLVNSLDATLVLQFHAELISGF